MAAERTLYAKEDLFSGRHRKKEEIDPVFFMLVLLLLGLGLAVLYSASFAQSRYDTLYETSFLYFKKQGLCAVIGLGAMAAFSRIPGSFWYRITWPLYGGSIILLLLVLVFGQSVNGAKRWIQLGGIQFQPSEVAKFTMILALARLSRDYGSRAACFRWGVGGFGAAVGGILIPLALERHLSAIMLMGMVAVAIMYTAGTRLKWILGGILGAAAFLVLYVSILGYAGDRITAWQHPEQDPADTGYQILQSLYAIGSGGMTGLGFGRSRQKYMYLPFQYNDYIFAVACEELGFLGAVSIILLFMALILRGYYLAHRACARYDTILGAGLISLMGVQTLLNLGVVTNLLPSTGIALPFFSYGGTALAVNLGEMGIVMSISRGRNHPTLQEEVL